MSLREQPFEGLMVLTGVGHGVVVGWGMRKLEAIYRQAIEVSGPLISSIFR